MINDRKPATHPIVPKEPDLPVVQNPAKPGDEPEDRPIDVRADVVDDPPCQQSPPGQESGTSERMFSKLVDGIVDVVRISADQQKHATEQQNETVKSTTAEPRSVKIRLIDRTAEVLKSILEFLRRDEGNRDRNIPDKHKARGDK